MLLAICAAVLSLLYRYSTLVGVMRRTLAELQKALSGLVVLSSELEAMATSLYDQQVSEYVYTHIVRQGKQGLYATSASDSMRTGQRYTLIRPV